MNDTKTANYDEPNSNAYAQRAIYRVLYSGGWFTVRQLMTLCKLSDPRGTISQMSRRGYIFEKRRQTNSHGKSFKYYRLVIPPEAKQQRTQKMGTKCTQNLGTQNSKTDDFVNI